MRNNPKITLRGFNLSGRGAGHVLGELQTAVMELLWEATQGLTVNEVEERLRCRRTGAAFFIGRGIIEPHTHQPDKVQTHPH
jgi:hypothetical protein